MQSTCPQCGSQFTGRTVAGRPQTYCTPKCRVAAHRARHVAPEQALQGSAAPSATPNVTGTPEAPDVEWLDCLPDLHRCVAGRINKGRTGKSIPREDAVVYNGGWVGKIRHKGAAIWVSEKFANLEDAKLAVERRLVELPEVLAAVDPGRPALEHGAR